MDAFIQLRRQLHQIPEPGFAEFKTQQLLLSYLTALPRHRVEIRTWKTGIIAKIPGLNPTCRIGYRTDMDALPIQEETTYPFRSQHEGMMHACGHDLHMAIAVGILTHFVHHPIDDDLIFLFEPAEEGPGGALPMMASTEFQTWKPDVLFALHIGPDYPVGTIATRPGVLFANSSELFIELEGASGHAAAPHLANDMVVAVTQLVSQLHSIVPRNIDPFETAVLSIGKLNAGSKENVIAHHAKLEGTIRTLSQESMQRMQQRVISIVQGIEQSFDCRATIDWGNGYLQVDNDEILTRHFMNWVQEHTEYQLVECREVMAAEDFGFFLQDIPGFMYWLGVETPYSLHHPKIEPNEKAIPVGIDVMTRYIEDLSLHIKKPWVRSV